MSSENLQPGAPGARIRRLSGPLIDQIAAGEVVERPASVVKELVENALDAEARRIRVEVRGGGRDLIAVADDGFGMSAQDARLSVERHATSKIATAEDLTRIGTFGFRGEALAAISSVSKLRLRSRLRGADDATEIRVEAGVIQDQRAVGAAPGTRVEVTELFGSVPARRKFLKSPATEWGHIADWLARAALALPAVHFDVQRDERPALAWPACDDPLDRIAAVISDDDAAAFMRVARDEGGASLEGFASRPERHRATTAGIYLYVNRRPVRDRVLQHALVEIYRDLVPRGRYPAAVLFLALPHERVDVNVHPAKWEVRFAEPQAIHQLVRHAVRDAIAARRWIAVGMPTADAGAGTSASPSASASASPSASMTAPRRVGFAADALREPDASDWQWARKARDAREQPGFEARGFRAPVYRAESDTPGAQAPVRFAELRLLGQFLATYLVLETDAQLLLVDQHAAHERVLFERLRAQWLERGVESQALLHALTLRIEPRALAALVAGRALAERLGFDLEPFGEDAVAIRALPALLADRDPAPLVRSLAEELAALGDAAGEPAGSGDAAEPLAAAGDPADFQRDRGGAADALPDSARDAAGVQRGEPQRLEAADRIFASLACHAARRKGDALSAAEQRALLEALDAIPWAPCCPHGRPVAVPFELAEIERRFARR